MRKQRFIFDLSDIAADINRFCEAPLDKDYADAVIVEHLRQFHYLNVDSLFDRSPREWSRFLRYRAPEVADQIDRELYRLFGRMAWVTFSSFKVHYSLRHHLLNVLVYEGGTHGDYPILTTHQAA